ncbi:MAG: terminase small subunit [Proteobacteria bacterium]|nr:terminase small subunit [Pseudomonadota bacterium]
MVKKIDNDKMLEMFKQGIPQKDIASHFNASCPAICKKLKRLLPQPENILDKYNFTEQQQQFVIEKAKGKNNTQAALSSYETGSMQAAKVIGSNLMQKPEIQQSIAELMDGCGLTRQYRIRRLKQHVDSALPDISLKGLDMSFKLDNSYPPQRNVNLNVDIVPTSPVDIQVLFGEKKENVDN